MPSLALFLLRLRKKRVNGVFAVNAPAILCYRRADLCGRGARFVCLQELIFHGS